MKRAMLGMLLVGMLAGAGCDLAGYGQKSISRRTELKAIADEPIYRDDRKTSVKGVTIRLPKVFEEPRKTSEATKDTSSRVGLFAVVQPFPQDKNQELSVTFSEGPPPGANVAAIIEGFARNKKAMYPSAPDRLTDERLAGPGGKPLDVKRMTVLATEPSDKKNFNSEKVVWQHDFYLIKEGERLLIVEWAGPQALAAGKGKNFFDAAKSAMTTLEYKPEPPPAPPAGAAPAGVPGAVPPVGVPGIPPAGVVPGVVPVAPPAGVPGSPPNR